MLAWSGLAEEFPEGHRRLANQHDEAIDCPAAGLRSAFEQFGLQRAVDHVEDHRVRHRVRLTEARIGAAYVGSPAGNLVTGLLMGFISETVANATILPSNLPLVGGQPLSSLLPGGTNNCSPSSDLDINAGVRGWWFYMNFTAPRATWVDN